MLVFKSRKPNTELADDKLWTRYGDFYYFMPNPEPLELIGVCCINKVETLPGAIIKQISQDDYLVMKDFVLNDLLRDKRPKGKWINVDDNNQLCVPTIRDVKAKFVLDSDFNQKMVPSDELFEYLVNNAEKISTMTISDLLDLVVKTLNRNYYITKQVVLGLELLDTDLLDKLLITIFCVEMYNENNEELFRGSPSQEINGGINSF